jgi:O-succinylbenzoate synthase
VSWSFRFKPYRLPLHPPLRTAHGWWRERAGLLLRLEAEDRSVGFGEVAPVPEFGTETLAEAEAACAALGGRVDEAALAAVPARLACVRFGLAEARTARPAPGPARVAVAALLPAGRGAVDALRRTREAGFVAFKWKVGVGDPTDERAVLDDLLAELPGYARLRLDANGAWDRREAARWLDRCAERPVEFVEQPLAPADEDGLRGLAADFPVALALDESVARLDDARRWQARGWPGVFVIKPALAGPLDETLAWRARTGADIVWSSAIETAVARAAILRALLAAPAGPRALGFGIGPVFGDRRWDGPEAGPLLDAGAIPAQPGEAAWNALN